MITGRVFISAFVSFHFISFSSLVNEIFAVGSDICATNVEIKRLSQ